MKITLRLALILLSLFFFGSMTMAQSSQDALKQADLSFQNGDFAQAGQGYQAALAQAPKNFHATARLGYIALLGNHLDEAQKWLTQALALNPAPPYLAIVKQLMAEVYYRRDDFSQAAPLLRAIGMEAKAAKLESFQGQTPYKIADKSASVSIPFIMTDPLPLLHVRVNGSTVANFFIDTGAGEVILDTEFAKQVGAREFGAEIGTFAGGKQAETRQGRIASLTLGSFVIKNVPVNIMHVRQTSMIFGGKRIDGVIGTIFLAHFLATLDYPKGQLVLAPRNSAPPTNVVSVPFWMAGDHFMVAHGTINDGKPVMLLVDTGLAGGGFTAPEATLSAAGITLDKMQAGEGIGGGGVVQVIPFTVHHLTLGKTEGQNIQGLFTGPYPFADDFGFHLSGTISHGYFRRYALTLDFQRMSYYLKQGQ